MSDGHDPLGSAPSWCEIVPRLAGELVDVREVVESDAGTLFELLSDPQVTEHLSSPPPSASAFAGFIRWAHSERAACNGVCFGIVPHGMNDAVGIIQVRAIGLTCATSEWGFAIGASFWSTGVFVEAANLVAEFAFTTMNVNRLEARAVGINGRGNGVLNKLGRIRRRTWRRRFASRDAPSGSCYGRCVKKGGASARWCSSRSRRPRRTPGSCRRSTRRRAGRRSAPPMTHRVRARTIRFS